MNRLMICVLLLSVWGCGDSSGDSAKSGTAGKGAALSVSDWRDRVEEILAIEGVERRARRAIFSHRSV
jgi:hypothetical protein